MNKIDKTLFTLRYLDDTESLTPPSFHSRQTTSNKFSSILEIAPCPISEASNSMEHELALLSRRLSRYGKQLKLGMIRPEDSHKEFHNLYDHFACLQSTEFLDVPSDTGLVALQSDLTLVATTFIPEGTMVTHIPYTFVRCSIPTIPCRIGILALLHKFVPFAGFDSFATQFDGPRQINCKVDFRGNESFLSAVKPISFREPITIQRTPQSMTDIDDSVLSTDDRNRILSII